jgi:hypothetical protein
MQNLLQQKLFDYGEIASPSSHGVKNRRGTFRSFEDQVNLHFQLKQTAPTTRESKRVGLLGYKVGMTHFWNKWGQIVPCTVL